MSQALAIVLLPLLVVIAGGAIFAIIIRYSSRPYFYIYATGVLLLLLAGLSLLPAFLVDGVWSLPGIGLAFIFMIASFVVFAQGNDELYMWKFRQRQERRQKLEERRRELASRPLLVNEVEQGIDWPEVERWLGDQPKRD